MRHAIQVPVTFGDCDPAGIVFYPNAYRWMDRCFHDLLRGHGGHAALCRTLGAVGIGLRSAEATFRSPMRDGDDLTLSIDRLDWAPKTLTVRYVGAVGDRTAFTGTEARALFIRTPDGMKAGEMAALKGMIDGHGED